MRSPQLTNQVRPEEAEILRTLTQAKDSSELRAVVAYAKLKQAASLLQWQRASGFEELVKCQQNYSAWETLIKAILTPLPTITQRTQQGEITNGNS